MQIQELEFLIADAFLVVTACKTMAMSCQNIATVFHYDDMSDRCNNMQHVRSL